MNIRRILVFFQIHLGPDYIRPNQSYLYSSERREKEVQRQHETIMNNVTLHLVRLYRMPRTSTMIEQFSQQLFMYLRARYVAPVSYLDAYRARKELKLMKTIQFRLKKHKYILRVTDKSGIFHLAHATDYERKAEAYRQKTAAYTELDNDPLWSIFDKVVRLLNDLRAKNYIQAWQLNQMMPDRKKMALAYLYFIPKPHKVIQTRPIPTFNVMNTLFFVFVTQEDTPLTPIVSSMNTPTTAISKFLDRLIRPLFDKHVRTTTIIDGVDLIRQLEQYVENGYLKPTTQFCTFDITDLYTMLPQEDSLNILIEFLAQYGYRKVNGIPLDAIRKLARIVLTENVFIYEKKFYRQIIGGAMGSAFTLTLANIFMWKWEKQLVHRQFTSNEIYGR